MREIDLEIYNQLKGKKDHCFNRSMELRELLYNHRHNSFIKGLVNETANRLRDYENSVFQLRFNDMDRLRKLFHSRYTLTMKILAVYHKCKTAEDFSNLLNLYRS